MQYAQHAGIFECDEYQAYYGSRRLLGFGLKLCFWSKRISQVPRPLNPFESLGGRGHVLRSIRETPWGALLNRTSGSLHWIHGTSVTILYGLGFRV